MSENGNESAFPKLTDWNPNTGECYDGAKDGLTKRELFAAMAMQGLSVGCAGVLDGEFTAYAKGPCNAEIAKRAVCLADALLDALEREK